MVKKECYLANRGISRYRKMGLDEDTILHIITEDYEIEEEKAEEYLRL